LLFGWDCSHSYTADLSPINVLTLSCKNRLPCRVRAVRAARGGSPPSQGSVVFVSCEGS
jgi:hypothetical protein